MAASLCFFFFVLFVRAIGISKLPPAVNFLNFFSLLNYRIFIMKKIIRKISLLLYVGIMLKLIPTMNKFILGEFHYQKNALLATFQLVKGQKKTLFMLGKANCLRKSFGSRVGRSLQKRLGFGYLILKASRYFLIYSSFFFRRYCIIKRGCSRGMICSKNFSLSLMRLKYL